MWEVCGTLPGLQSPNQADHEVPGGAPHAADPEAAPWEILSQLAPGGAWGKQ